MNVGDFFQSLSYGELSNLSLSFSGSGEIIDDQQNRLINYINRALLRLHSRFKLRENEVLIQQVAHITKYILHSDYSRTIEDPPVGRSLYIIDYPPNLFTNDVIRILSVDGIEGRFPLNDEGNIHSLFTLQPHILQVPDPRAEEPMSVIYQAKHPILPYDSITTSIEIPEVLEPALSAFVAFAVYSDMNGQENGVMAKKHLDTYEMICNEVTEQDLVSTSMSSTSVKFNSRGWV